MLLSKDTKGQRVLFRGGRLVLNANELLIRDFDSFKPDSSFQLFLYVPAAAIVETLLVITPEVSPRRNKGPCKSDSS